MFETVEAVDGAARVERDAAVAERGRARRPRRHGHVSRRRRHQPASAGDALLFVGDGVPRRTAPANHWDFRLLDRVAADTAQRPHARELERGRSARSIRRRSAGRAAAGVRAAPARRRVRPQRAGLAQHADGLPHGYELTFRAAAGIRVAARRRSSSQPSTTGRGFVISPAASSTSISTPCTRTIAVRQLRRARQGRLQLRRASLRRPAPTSSSTRVTSGRPRCRAQEFALSGKVTRLGLAGANYAQFSDRGARAPACSRSPSRCRSPRTRSTTPVAGDTHARSRVSADGLRARAAAARARHARRATARRSCTRPRWSPRTQPRTPAQCMLEIDPPLPAPLARDSVVVHANVALASHGETVTQILGAGNASDAVPALRAEAAAAHLSRRRQRDSAPPASSPCASTTSPGSERDTLFGAAPRDRAFTLRADEQGRNFVAVRRRRARRAAAERREQRARHLSQGPRRRRQRRAPTA